MKIPLKYSLRNFMTRKLTNGITVAGVALVVFVFAAVLMMAHGVEKTLVSTGSSDNVLVARKAANGEITSIILSDTYNTVLTLPHIARTAEGAPIVSGEVLVVINLGKLNGGLSNTSVRGVSPMAFRLRPHVTIVEGRTFDPGAREVVVGSAVVRNFVGVRIGDKVTFGGDQWTVVGRFDAGGSGFDSEIWGDSRQLMDAFNRSGGYSTMTFRLDDPNSYDAFKTAFERDPRLQEFEPEREQRFFEKQSEFLSTFIRILGLFITVVFSLGSTIGAMITMYAAVANRTVEIGTLRALGFRRRSVLTTFLVESIFLSLAGGILGVLLASLLQFFSISTLNYGSFAELEFSFALSPDIVFSSLTFSIFMGFFGGFLPAARAARMNIVNALRAG